MYKSATPFDSEVPSALSSPTQQTCYDNFTPFPLFSVSSLPTRLTLNRIIAVFNYHSASFIMVEISLLFLWLFFR